MAMFRIINTSGTRFAVPPPVDLIMDPGASTDVDQASLDTAAVRALMSGGQITVIPLANIVTDAVSGATLSGVGGNATSRLGSAAVPLGFLAAEAMTFTHNNGIVATIDAYDQATGEPALVTAYTITTNDATELVVTNDSGGALDLVLVISWDEGVESLGANIPLSDARIVIA